MTVVGPSVPSAFDVASTFIVMVPSDVTEAATTGPRTVIPAGIGEPAGTEPLTTHWNSPVPFESAVKAKWVGAPPSVPPPPPVASTPGAGAAEAAALGRPSHSGPGGPGDLRAMTRAPRTPS